MHALRMLPTAVKLPIANTIRAIQLCGADAAPSPLVHVDASVSFPLLFHFFSFPDSLSIRTAAKISVRRNLSCPRQDRTRALPAPKLRARKNPPKHKSPSTGKKRNISIRRRNSKPKPISPTRLSSKNSPRRISRNVLTTTPIFSTGTKSGKKLWTPHTLLFGNGSSAANSMHHTTALTAISLGTKTKPPSSSCPNPKMKPRKSSPIASCIFV